MRAEDFIRDQIAEAEVEIKGYRDRINYVRTQAERECAAYDGAAQVLEAKAQEWRQQYRGLTGEALPDPLLSPDEVQQAIQARMQAAQNGNTTPEMSMTPGNAPHLAEHTSVPPLAPVQRARRSANGAKNGRS